MTSSSLSQDVLDICRPFFKSSGLNAFSYSRIFKDRSRSELWSDAAAFDHTFHKAGYIIGAYTPQYFKSNERYAFMEKKVETYPGDIRDRYRNQLRDQREHFDHCHCFSILNQQKEFYEYFIFYASRSNDMALNYYLNNIDQLENFSENFIQQASRLIDLADHQRVPGVESPRGSYQPSAVPIPDKLTPREKDVARLLMIGATIKDIAKTLCVSPRTIESHVENMKAKLGCTRKSILAQQLHASKQLLD